MRAAKVWIMTAVVAAMAFAAFGCSPLTPVGTIYGSAVDERSLSQQAYDRKLRTSIEARYAQDSDVSYWGTSVFVYMADVYLAGEYDTEANRDKAIQLARGVEGVRNVYSYFLPKQSSPCDFADRQQMRASINYELYGASDVTATNVELAIIQCDVVLFGIMGNQMEIDKAVDIVKKVDGVQNVKSFLRVLHKAPPAGATPAKPKG